MLFGVVCLFVSSHTHIDFAPDFPREAIPDFHKELQHFRIMPDGKELVLETLLSFCHFESAPAGSFRDNLGVPPLSSSLESCSRTANGGVTENNHGENDDAFVYSGGDCGDDDDDDDEDDEGEDEEDAELASETEEDFRRRITPKSSVIKFDGPAGGGTKKESPKGGTKKKASKLLTFSQIQWIGK